MYEVEYGARISEVVEVAGGFTKKADSQYVYQNLNLAKKVEDGDETVS